VFTLLPLEVVSCLHCCRWRWFHVYTVAGGGGFVFTLLPVEVVLCLHCYRLRWFRVYTVVG
jgi:hypothetical protein